MITGNLPCPAPVPRSESLAVLVRELGSGVAGETCEICQGRCFQLPGQSHQKRWGMWVRRGGQCLLKQGSLRMRPPAETPSRAGCRNAVETRGHHPGDGAWRICPPARTFPLVEASPGQGFFKNNAKCHFLQGAASDCYS